MRQQTIGATMSARSVAIETHSPAETEALGIRLACALEGGMMIGLTGQLGAGKTVFVRGLACGLNLPPGVLVTSPTYVLQHIYRGGRLTVYHIDAYRLVDGAAEFESSGLGECFADPRGLVCVEWPERVSDYAWPGDRLDVQIEHFDPRTRRILLCASGPRSEEALSRLMAV